MKRSPRLLTRKNRVNCRILVIFEWLFNRDDFDVSVKELNTRLPKWRSIRWCLVPVRKIRMTAPGPCYCIALSDSISFPFAVLIKCSISRTWIVKYALFDVLKFSITKLSYNKVSHLAQWNGVRIMNLFDLMWFDQRVYVCHIVIYKNVSFSIFLSHDYSIHMHASVW